MAVDAWTFVWLFFILKIPIVALFLLVRWAVREPPEIMPNDDGGIGPRARPLHPYHPRARRGGRGPIAPRRGPHGDPLPTSPPRVRTVSARGRLIKR
jgi:hypothetical protein